MKDFRSAIITSRKRGRRHHNDHRHKCESSHSRFTKCSTHAYEHMLQSTNKREGTSSRGTDTHQTITHTNTNFENTACSSRKSTAFRYHRQNTLFPLAFFLLMISLHPFSQRHLGSNNKLIVTAERYQFLGRIRAPTTAFVPLSNRMSSNQNTFNRKKIIYSPLFYENDPGKISRENSCENCSVCA